MARLQSLTALTLEAELAKLCELKEKEKGLRLAYEQLSQSGPAPHSGTASDARTAELYRIWCDRRRIEINQQLAMLLAQISARQVSARRAFGRDAVLRKLARAAK